MFRVVFGESSGISGLGCRDKRDKPQTWNSSSHSIFPISHLSLHYGVIGTPLYVPLRVGIFRGCQNR